MDYYIDLKEGGFSTAEFQDIKRCLETLLSIRAGSQPYDRDLGIDYDGAIGYPASVAMNMLSVEIIDKVERYEPRVKVDSIEFDTGEDGQMVPRIRFTKADEGQE